MPRNIEEFDRNAVITIEGGGVYALTLLGQLEGVVKNRDIVPLALAGTSAGAIVATLFWSKLGKPDARPREIREEIVKLIPLTSLVGPFDGIGGASEFNFSVFRSLRQDCESFLKAIETLGEAGWIGKMKGGAKAIADYKKLKQKLKPHWDARGFFCGTKLEEEVERILRQSPEINALGLRADDRVTFQHYHEVFERDRKKYFRPPLLLAATNLSTKKVEIFSSLDERCRNVSVAKAVRASAGFPVFFRPVGVTPNQSSGWYVDGGVVSNFPSWVFAEEFRRSMSESPIFRGLAMRHWIHIGLKIEDDVYVSPTDLEKPETFFRAFASMLTGNARNELDNKLSERLSRSFIIRQPQQKTGGPDDVLAFDKMSEATITDMYTKGSEFAEEELRSLSFTLPKNSGESTMEMHLNRLVDQVRFIVGKPDGLEIRSNIFIPDGERLVVCYSVNMNGHSDENMVFSSTVSGLTGACYTSRSPLMCNLERVASLVEAKTVDSARLFNMTPEEQEMVKKDRTWLASVPIFDPFDSSYGARERPSIHQVTGVYFYQMNSILDGAILGVLNVDTNWSYSDLNLDMDPMKHYADQRVIMIMDLMQQTALRLGHTLGAALARKEQQ